MRVNCILVSNNRNRVDVSASLNSVQVVGIKDGKPKVLIANGHYCIQFCCIEGYSIALAFDVTTLF